MTGVVAPDVNQRQNAINALLEQSDSRRVQSIPALLSKDMRLTSALLARRNLKPKKFALHERSYMYVRKRAVETWTSKNVKTIIVIKHVK